MTQAEEIFVNEHRTGHPGYAGNRRQIRRSKIFAPITLQVMENSVRGHMLDIATAGALCVSDTFPAHGAVVDVGWQSYLWAAEVVWMTERRFGLRFLAPLHIDLVQKVLDNRAARSSTFPVLG